MSCFNFVIMKVNGADVSNLPYEEAVQLFLNAEDPILVEVRRRCFDDSNKLSFFNYDTNKSPTLAVIASTNTPKLYEGTEFCRISSAPAAEKLSSSLTLMKDKNSSDERPAMSLSSISCQTELSAFSNDSTFFRKKHENTTSTNAETIIDGCLRSDFDIEEITLHKSQSAENLGFTISYSRENLSGSESGSDECIDEPRDGDGVLNINYFDAHKCKIYISDIVPNSLADRDGRLRQGDRILQINGRNVLEDVDPNNLLTENKNSVTMLVSRFAYLGEDDFLDSAVYCDDKECQDERHQSSICECEQNTFSSKSSIAHSELQKSCTPTTVTNIYPILPIAVEKVSDLLNHASIKAQLESVNKEISLLNSQISIMKLHQSHADKQLSPLKTKEKPEKSAKAKSTELQSRLKPEKEVEHIYETIPEDIESDAYYCSPYEGVNEMRVEQWLKSIGCTKSHLQSVSKSKKNDSSAAGSCLQNRNNPCLDDYDNSSSAYNTGGSCNSALLALEQQNKPTLFYKMDPQKKLASNCKNIFYALNQPSENSKQLGTTSRNHNILSGEKPQPLSCVSRRISIPSTPVPISSNHCPTDIDSDGHSTLVARSTVYRMCQYKDVEEHKEEDLPEVAWKVKRRPDGSRYIVRRVIKKCGPIDGDQRQDPLSAIGFKRQENKLKERRDRHKNPTKEKHHAQHWLV